MADATLQLASIARSRSPVLDQLELTPGGYVAVTVHREANVRPSACAASPTVSTVSPSPSSSPHTRARRR